MATDEDALSCDLAEVYGIYDFRQLPATRVAVFAYGLRGDARIKLLMSEQRVSMEILLQAGIYDRLSLLVWSKTKDAERGRNRPVSMMEILTGSTKEKQEMTFNSGADFERYRQQLLSGGENKWQQT